MRRIIWILIIILLLAVPATAMDFSAPTAPQDALKLMPEEVTSFGEDFLFVIQSAFKVVQPNFVEAVKVCVSLILTAITVGLLFEVSTGTNKVVELAGVIMVSILLFQPANSLIHLGTDTVQQISQYGRLLLPVMTGALAAQGAVTKSGALYTATAFFDAILSSAVSQLLIPLVYIFMCVSVVCHLFNQSLLKEIGKFIKWLLTWGLKVVLYIFTGYIGITGVVGGTTDAAMLKATKLTISGMVPVVGNILSDASEAVLVSAGVMKNAAGIYGLLAVVTLFIGPFLQIGAQYLMLKVTGGICEMFGTKKIADVIKDFSSVMGLVLAMTGTVCLIFLISTICFMKGVI